MVKCPNCGSTAQPRLATPPRLYNDIDAIKLQRKCDCGCVYNVWYTLAEVRIVKQGASNRPFLSRLI